MSSRVTTTAGSTHWQSFSSRTVSASGSEPAEPVGKARSAAGYAATLALVGLLSACGVAQQRDRAPSSETGYSAIPDAVPKAEPKSPYGNPHSYVVNGRQYFTLSSARGFSQRGIASWYGPKFHGRRTSSGETYNMYKMTAAHKTLPLPTYVSVRSLTTGREIVVRINDRGPFVGDRILDLSYAAATKLGIVRDGTGLVEVRALVPGTGNQSVTSSRPSRQAVRFEPTWFVVQAGAFRALANAAKLRAKLATISRVPVRVRRATSDGQVMYRVWLGPVSSVEEADRLSDMLGVLGVEGPRIVHE